MSEKHLQFLTYDQAIEAAKKEADVEFIGLRFEAPHRRLDAYFIYVDSDEPDYVNIAHERSELFSRGAEEQFYEEDDAPAAAKTCLYVRESELGNAQVRGANSEYALFEVLPGVNEPNSYPNETAFMADAARAFAGFWGHA